MGGEEIPPLQFKNLKGDFIMTGEMALEDYSALQIGKPVKSYRKTILGKVTVKVWDQFERKPKYVILYGKPESAIVDVWSESEDRYFKTNNQILIDKGLILQINRDDLPVVEPAKQYTDDDLKELFKNKFFKFRSILNNIDSEALLIRMLRIAEDLELSEKTTKAITARLSEIQTADFHVPSLTENTQ